MTGSIGGRMNDKPLVSVITPFFNTSPEFLEEAIQSVFAQTYENWELLLVDDGSAPANGEVARSCAAKHPGRVIYLEHAGHANKGHSASRNLGIVHSKGRYIAFLDADDIWLPGKLEEQVDILERRPAAGMVYANTLYWYSWRGRPEDTYPDFVPRLRVATDALYRPLALLPLFLSGEATVPSMNSLLVRRDAVTRSGGFEESFRSLYGDQHFYAKLCIAEHIFVSDTVHDWYRQHPGSMTSRANRSRTEAQGRRFFLQWLERYLTRNAVTDGRVWTALRREMWLIHDPKWVAGSEGLRNFVRRAKKWILKADRRMIPESIGDWIWTRGVSRPDTHS